MQTAIPNNIYNLMMCSAFWRIALGFILLGGETVQQ